MLRDTCQRRIRIWRILRDRLKGRVRARQERSYEPRTRTYFPFSLKAGDAGEAGHCEKVEEYLGGVDHYDGFRHDHLWSGLDFLFLREYGRINPKPYDPNDGDDDKER